MDNKNKYQLPRAKKPKITGEFYTPRNLDSKKQKNARPVAVGNKPPMTLGQKGGKFVPKSIQDQKVVSASKEESVEKQEVESPKNSHSSDVKFPQTLKLFQAISQMKLVTMTHIQSLSLEPLLSGKNVLAKSKTGSGKTLAFLIPAIESVIKNPKGGVQILVLLPTRELALQTLEQCKKLLAFHHQTTKVCVTMGGTNKQTEATQLKSNPHIILATPGRFLDHIKDKSISSLQLQSIRMLVLDEADRMLDMGFAREMSQIMDALPAVNQTVLFSATLSSDVIKASRIKSNVVEISTVENSENATNHECLQEFITVGNKDMIPILHSLLSENIDKKVVVFFQTAKMVDYFAELFRENGYEVGRLTGRMTQNARTKTFFEFSKTKKGIMFSTDVSARGLDVPGIDVIIQMGTPEEIEDYIHRIGRTSRAGLSGRAILCVRPHEANFVQKLESKQIVVKNLQIQPAKTQIKLSTVDLDVAHGAYKSYLGYLIQQFKNYGWTKNQAVEEAVSWGKMVGLKRDNLNIDTRILRKMGVQPDILSQYIQR